MKEYKTKYFLENDKELMEVYNLNHESIGTIKRAVMRKCDDLNTFEFTSKSGEKTVLGLKHRRFIDFNVAKYIFVDAGHEIVYRERPGQNLLIFTVTGTLDGAKIKAQENLSGELILYLDKKIKSITREDKQTKSIIYQVENDVEVTDSIFGLGLLMYLMFKSFKRENTQFKNN